MEDDVVQEVWPDLVKAFSRLPTVSAGIHLLPVGLTGRKRMNRVRVHQDRVVRVSDGSNSQDQPIPRDHFLEFARMAIRASGGRFCIKGTQIVKTGRCGSFVSTSLALLPYFEYRSGQILVFSKDQFERVKGPGAAR
jgi:hypothetical protein